MTQLALHGIDEGRMVPTPRAISGARLRAARGRARLHNKEMADLLGIHTRTLNNWLESGVPKHAEEYVQDTLAPYLTPEDTPRLQRYSDLELLGELMRRLDTYRRAAEADDDDDDDDEVAPPAPTALPSSRTSGEISGRTTGRPTRTPPNLQP
jgi:transcriptional regulator with XRE-family HTH domain